MLGLQSMLLCYTLAFEVMREEFVQVLHSGGNHWLTVSTIGCPPFYTVKVYDSLYSDLPTQMKEQICALCLLFKHSVMRAHLLKCLEKEDVKSFPCNRTQQKNKRAKLKYFASAKHRREGAKQK